MKQQTFIEKCPECEADISISVKSHTQLEVTTAPVKICSECRHSRIINRDVFKDLACRCKTGNLYQHSKKGRIGDMHEEPTCNAYKRENPTKEKGE